MGSTNAFRQEGASPEGELRSVRCREKEMGLERISGPPGAVRLSGDGAVAVEEGIRAITAATARDLEAAARNGSR